jgi:hypothetical protein
VTANEGLAMPKLPIRLCTILIAALIAALLTTPARAAVYLLQGLGYSEYDYAQLIIDLKDGPVAGEVRPLRGDLTPSVKVTGANTAPGVLNLTFHLPSGSRTARFKKSTEKDEIRWEAAGKENELYFYRRSTREFSDYALTLTNSSCGPFYKNLEVRFNKTTTLAKVNEFINANPELGKLRVVSYVDALLEIAKQDKIKEGEVPSRAGSLSDDLRKRWRLQVQEMPRANENLRSYYSENVGDLEVSIGSELYFTEKARQSGLFEYVNLARGGCGGAERSFFAIDRGLLFDSDRFSKVKFQSFVESGLSSFAQQDRNGRKWNFRLAQQTLSPLVVPPYSSSYRVKVYVASEISRGTTGEWDTFFVNFEPTELPLTDKKEYGIVVTVERLKANKRSSGSDRPPDESYFKRELSYENEAQVTTRIDFFFSRRTSGGWCHFETEGFEPRKVKCDNQ